MPDNHLSVWNALAKTDPKHTKKFTRAGGFKGTSVKPIYQIHKMTEQFGPAGKGWGMTKPEFQTAAGAESEVLVYCTVGLWYGDRDNVVYGVGGDKVVAKQSARMFSDDEAFKKAYTDALSNAMKQIGMAADIHMGQHDDDKYVSELRQEFNGETKVPGFKAGSGRGNGNPVEQDPPGAQPWKGPLNKTALSTALRKFHADLLSCSDEDELIALLNVKASMDLIDQCKHDLPKWWYGDEDKPGLQQKIEEKRRELSDIAADLSVLDAG